MHVVSAAGMRPKIDSQRTVKTAEHQSWLGPAAIKRKALTSNPDGKGKRGGIPQAGVDARKKDLAC